MILSIDERVYLPSLRMTLVQVLDPITLHENQIDFYAIHSENKRIKNVQSSNLFTQ